MAVEVTVKTVEPELRPRRRRRYHRCRRRWRRNRHNPADSDLRLRRDAARHSTTTAGSLVQLAELDVP